MAFLPDRFEICHAREQDGPRMQALIVSVLEEYGLVPDLADTDADVLDIALHYRRDGGEFYSVFEQGQLCGTMGLKHCGDCVCELRKMYLLPHVRGMGLGKHLLQWAQSEALRLGFVTMQLETASVLKEAIALYEKNGFIRVCGSPHVGRCDRIYRKTLIKE